MKKLIIALFCASASFAATAGGNINAGKALAEKYSCAACHGKDYNSPIDPSYPKLAGQHKDYLQHALTAYKRGAKKSHAMRGLVHAAVRNQRCTASVPGRLCRYAARSLMSWLVSGFTWPVMMALLRPFGASPRL